MARILVTGATGFVGRHVIKVLEARGDDVAIFARLTSDVSEWEGHLRIERGDLGDVGSMERAFQGIDTLLNVASLGFGHAPMIVQACQRAHVPRAVFVGTTAVFTTLPAKTKAVRLEAERLIRESGLAFTLLRPTMIYGTPKDRNIWRLIQFIRRSPVMPVIGNGRYLQQPVHVQDVAEAIVNVVGNGRTIGQAYNLPGAEALPFIEMIRIVAELLVKKIRIISIPSKWALRSASVARRIPAFPRISSEQLLRLEEDKAFDVVPAREGFDYRPLKFEAGVRRELEWLPH